MSATAIIGAQFGSEGKGVVAAALAGRFDAAVRVGGPNAGHSFRVMDDTGDLRTYKMRGVPCAWVNPGCDLYIGAGAVVDPHLLSRELNDLPAHVRVYVDANAAVVTEEDVEAETHRGLRDAVGSTLEGVGAARARKMGRQSYTLAGTWHEWHPHVEVVSGVSRRVSEYIRAGAEVMLEGTQGSGLSLDHGWKYPYVTSADTNVSGLLSQAGLPPTAIGHTFLVARTLPIRVAGNSGPAGSEELTWDQIPVEQPERTTVTNKVRRIFRWSDPVFSAAVQLNDPCGVFLMFADYLVPEMAGTTDADALIDASRPTDLGDLRELTATIEGLHRVPVVAYGTGGPGWALAVRGRCAHGESWDAPQW